VTFRPIRNSDDDWTVVAEYPGAEPREIAGFKSKADVDDWMKGDRKVAWLPLGNSANPGFSSQMAGLYGSGAVEAMDIARTSARWHSGV
jgi:hypothetical protein